MTLPQSLLGLALVLIVGTASAADGLITQPGRGSVAETVERIERGLESKGITVFARIDHSGAAQRAGLELRPTQLIIFGNPKGGTPIMNAAPTVAIDLPLKALVWEDAAGKVWVSVNDGDWLAARHDVPAGLAKGLGAARMLVEQALQ